MMDPIFNPAAIIAWGKSVGVAALMSWRWGWAGVEVIHFIGICLLFGTVGMFDLRMMNAVRGISLMALHRLVPYGVLGFALCVMTGALFVIAAADQYLYNPAWQLKMLMLVIAGVNMAAFYLTTFTRLAALGEDDAPPWTARLFAAISLLSWIAAITAGRVITAYRPPGWFWCAWCQ